MAKCLMRKPLQADMRGHQRAPGYSKAHVLSRVGHINGHMKPAVILWLAVLTGRYGVVLKLAVGSKLNTLVAGRGFGHDLTPR